MSSNYKILWLNGSLQGRTLHLPEGLFTIGPDGDILLDLSQPNQIELLISEEGVVLKSSLPGWIDGFRQEEISVLPPGKVIEMAGLALVIGLAEETLEIQPIPPHREEVKRKRIWMLGLSGVLMIVLSLLLLVLDALQTPVNKGLTREQRVMQQLAQSHLPKVTHQWLADGTLELAGYCDDSQDLGKVLASLAVQGIIYRVDTICVDQVINNIRVVLEQNGFNDTQILPGKESGAVIISGGITSGDKWDKAIEQIKTIKGLTSWQVVNNIDAQIIPLLNEDA